MRLDLFFPCWTWRRGAIHFNFHVCTGECRRRIHHCSFRIRPLQFWFGKEGRKHRTENDLLGCWVQSCASAGSQVPNPFHKQIVLFKKCTLSSLMCLLSSQLPTLLGRLLQNLLVLIGRNLLISMVNLCMFVLIPGTSLRLISYFLLHRTTVKLCTWSAVPSSVKEAGACLWSQPSLVSFLSCLEQILINSVCLAFYVIKCATWYIYVVTSWYVILSKEKVLVNHR